MNLRQKYKREKKRNEELRKKLHEWNVDVRIPNLVRIVPADIEMLCAEEVFWADYMYPPEEYSEHEVLRLLMDKVIDFVNFEHIDDKRNQNVKCRATLLVVKPRKD